MFERFDRRSRTVVLHAREEAQRSGATKLEAEHLLLALSRRSASDAARVLAEAGLDHDGLRHALDAELRRSLDTAGITISMTAIAERPVPSTGEPRFGASAKRALQRAVTVARRRGDRRLLPGHILIGVLQAGEGTVPRALTLAGIDAGALAGVAEAALGEPG
jgi:ATP-dependent Clp protease ATP-binding subunit ClpA